MENKDKQITETEEMKKSGLPVVELPHSTYTIADQEEDDNDPDPNDSKNQKDSEWPAPPLK